MLSSKKKALKKCPVLFCLFFLNYFVHSWFSWSVEMLRLERTTSRTFECSNGQCDYTKPKFPSPVWFRAQLKVTSPQDNFFSVFYSVLSLSTVCLRVKQQKRDTDESSSHNHAFRKQCSAKSHGPLCSDDDWVRIGPLQLWPQIWKMNVEIS